MSPFSPSWKGPSTGREAFDVIHWKPDAGAEAFCSRPSTFISAKRDTRSHRRPTWNTGLLQ